MSLTKVGKPVLQRPHAQRLTEQTLKVVNDLTSKVGQDTALAIIIAGEIAAARKRILAQVHSESEQEESQRHCEKLLRELDKLLADKTNEDPLKNWLAKIKETIEITRQHGLLLLNLNNDSTVRTLPGFLFCNIQKPGKLNMTFNTHSSNFKVDIRIYGMPEPMVNYKKNDFERNENGDIRFWDKHDRYNRREFNATFSIDFLPTVIDVFGKLTSEPQLMSATDILNFLKLLGITNPSETIIQTLRRIDLQRLLPPSTSEPTTPEPPHTF